MASKRKSTKRNRAGRRKRPFDSDLERGVREIRKGAPLREGARVSGASVYRLRKYLKKTGIGQKEGRRWIVRGDRRIREFTFFSDGREVKAKFRRSSSSTRVGRYLAAVSIFDETNDPDVLQPFEGDYVIDMKGREFPFETRPNVLRRLLETQEPFEEIYRIVT